MHKRYVPHAPWSHVMMIVACLTTAALALCLLGSSDAQASMLEPQAAGKLTYSSNTLNFYLRTGYHGGSESGALRSYTIKNTGSVAVTGIRLQSFGGPNARTTDWQTDDESTGAGHWETENRYRVPYVLTNKNGTVNFNTNTYLEDVADWSDSQSFDLAAGASKTLYFTVASPFYAGYTVANGQDITNTIQIASDNAGTKTVNLRMRSYEPEGMQATVGTGNAIDFTAASSVNLGSMRAGTGALPDDVPYNSTNYNCAKQVGIKNTCTTVDNLTNSYPNLVVESVFFENNDDGIFGVDYGSLYFYRTSLGRDSVLSVTVYADASYLPAGTYTSNLCFEVSPYNTTSNGTDSTDAIVNGGHYPRLVKVPVSVKVTGTNPNIPAAVTNLRAEAGNGYVGLTWDKLNPPANASGYVIWRTDKEGGDSLDEVVDLNETSYVDRAVANGATYTYYVTPRFGGSYTFLKRSNYASATPSAAATGRPLAPTLSDTEGRVGAVRLTWTLDQESQLQFDKGDGVGAYPAIDHFNIYRDGSLVATYSQSAYDDSTWGMYWYPDGSGISKTVYRWIYDVPSGDAYTWHTYRVSAVTKAGAESYLSNDMDDEAKSDVPMTVRLDGSWSTGSGVSLDFGWGTETWVQYVGYGITYKVERKETGAGDFVEVKAGETDDDYASWTDTYAAPGKTYTYRVTGSNSAGTGTPKELTITTSGTSSEPPRFSYETWTVTDGVLLASAYVESDATTVTLYRKMAGDESYTSVASTTVSNGDVSFTDVPPASGTYTYHMQFRNAGGVVGSYEFEWAYNKGASTDDLPKTPGKVERASVRPGDCKALFEWDPVTPTATTDAATSYQICQYAFDGEGDISLNTADAITVPDGGGRFVLEHDRDGIPLSNGNTYYFMIRAVNAAGVSDWTDLGACTPNGDDWTTEPPSAPEILNPEIQWSTDLGEYVLHIEWQDTGGGEAKGYYVSVNSPAGGTEGSTVDASVYSYDYRSGATVLDDVQKGTYTIRVAAYNSRAPLGEDFTGGVASSVTLTHGTASAPPRAPTVRDDRPSDSAFIRLVLNPDYDDPNKQFVSGYEVWRSQTSGDGYTLVGTVEAEGSSTAYYDDYDISGYEYRDPASGTYHAPTTYYYRVYALIGEQKSTNSDRPVSSPAISNAACSAAYAVNQSISSLPDPSDAAGIASHVDEIARVKDSFDGLVPTARATFVTEANATKLASCVAAAASAADRAAAQAVDAAVAALGPATDIAALTSQSEVDGKVTAITEARAAYDALTPEQRELLAAGTAAALEDAESAIEVAQARTLIAAIPNASAMTVESLSSDRNLVVNARAAYDGLTGSQRTQVDAFATYNNATITAAEGKIAQNEALVDVKALIDALPEADAITRPVQAELISQVTTARNAYDALTVEQKSAVGDVWRLTEAEAKLSSLTAEARGEAGVVQAVIDALDATQVTNGTTSTTDAIAAATEARAACAGLADDAKPYLDTSKLDAYEAAIKARQQSDFAAEVEALGPSVAGDTPIAVGVTAQYAASEIDNTTVSWTSGNPAVVTVDATTGVVTGAAPGSAMVVATYAREGYGGVMLTATVSREIVVSNVRITGADQVSYGETIELSLVKDDEDSYTWTSDNTSVATVDARGMLTAHKVGTATIWATNNAHPAVKASKTVRVLPIPVARPVANSFTYDGKPHTALSGGTGYTLSGTTSATEVGTYSVRATLQEGYCWTDGSTAPYTVTWKITTSSKPMYRLYNPNSGEHFYTASAQERAAVIGMGWNDEGIGWVAPTSGAEVYRLYNQYAGEHHYTLSSGERDALVAAGWTYEGVGWYSDAAKRVPLYREYNPNAFANNHNYTTSAQEHRMLLGLGWRDEGTAWYGM